jgi:hypothetical protein
VHQAVQVSEPVLWIFLCGYRQFHLLLGHHSLAHTSLLRLSLRMNLDYSTAFLRHVIGFPYLRLLRRLRPM